jgi:hypothetical protein
MKKAKITTGKRPQLTAKEVMPVAQQKPAKERKKKNA